MVYILHLSTPLYHARHYTGYSTDRRTLAERVELHQKGRAGCRFTRALHELGISLTLARVFKGKKMRLRLRAQPEKHKGRATLLPDLRRSRTTIPPEKEVKGKCHE